MAAWFLKTVKKSTVVCEVVTASQHSHGYLLSKQIRKSTQFYNLHITFVSFGHLNLRGLGIDLRVRLAREIG